MRMKAVVLGARRERKDCSEGKEKHGRLREDGDGGEKRTEHRNSTNI